MDESRQQLIRDNINLVYYIISRYYPSWIKDEDIVQIGMVGLCKAAHYWDESKGVKFNTYAGAVIFSEIRREFGERYKQRDLESKLLSLDTTITTDEKVTLEDTLANEDYVDCFNTDIEWSDFVSKLTNRERELILLKSKGLSVEEIAEVMSVLPGTVCANLRKIKNKWRYRYGNY